jgi:phenylpropionate dioxygenase-like ring-hydroxylating dioxygenase large terminal subunit
MTAIEHHSNDFRRLSRVSVFSPEVYDEELRHVFADSWLFIGHASEIPQSGDYVTRRMGDDEVIMCRTKRGDTRVLLNSRAHRGTQLCRTDSGSTTLFRCVYHSWVHDTDGNLRGIRNRRLFPPDGDIAMVPAQSFDDAAPTEAGGRSSSTATAETCKLSPT